MATEFNPPDLDFGIVIAFVAPGFISLVAISYQSQIVKSWIDSASDKGPTVGVFLFVLLASLALGLAISGIRSLVLERLFKLWRWKGLGKYAYPPFNLDWKKVTVLHNGVVVDKLSSLVTIRDNFYRYYQFYGNAAFAVALWGICRCCSNQPGLTEKYWVILIGVVAALLLGGIESNYRYVKAVNELLA